MNMKKSMTGFFVACFAVVLAMGCGTDGDSNPRGIDDGSIPQGIDDGSIPKGTTGTLSLAVTDAPVDEAEAVQITFTSVYLQDVEGTKNQGPFAVPEENQSINLMEYTGTDSKAVVSGIQVPAGVYRLRLKADLTFSETEQRSWIAFSETSPKCTELEPGAVWIEGETSCRYPLEIPSHEFKPKGYITITSGGNASVTVEFDLRKNIVDPQNRKNIAYKLKPTGLRLVDNLQVGSIAGTISPDFFGEGCSAQDARVYLYERNGEDDFIPEDMSDDNTDLITSAMVKEIQDGETLTYAYAFGFIPEGGYALALTCNPDDDPEVDDVDFQFEAQVDSVTVVAGEQTSQDINLMTGP